MHTETRNALLPLTLLASASGARTWAGLAALEPRSIVPVLAAGELVLDKLPNIQPRIAAPSLIGRIAAGAVIGAIVARRTGADSDTLAVVGGITAFVSAQATYRMRRSLMERLPPFAAAVVEDLTVMAVASAGAALVGRVVDSAPAPASIL